jgi:hypothetical protein
VEFDLTPLVDTMKEFKAVGPETGYVENPDLGEDDEDEDVPQDDTQVGEVGDGNTTRRRELNIFLPDTRTFTTYGSYPARTVGRWGGCTATLIGSLGVILTNSHCMAYNADGSFSSANWNTVFYAGFRNGYYLGSSTARAAYFDKTNDYCALKLRTNLATSLGWMGSMWSPLSYFTGVYRSVNMISYSGDHCTSWYNCGSKLATGLTRGTSGADVSHDLDGTRGSSGSTVFMWINNGPYHVALNWGEYRYGEVSLTLSSYSNSYRNVAKAGSTAKPGYDWAAVQ